MIGVLHDRRQNRGISLALLALLVVTIIIGVAVTHSRTGMALLFVAGLSSLLLAWRHDQAQSGRRLLRFCDWCQSSRTAPRISVRICWIRAAFRSTKASMICAGRSPRLLRRLPLPTCHLAAGLELSRRFMSSSPHERSSWMEVRQPRSQRLAGVVAHRGDSGGRACLRFFGMVGRLYL